MTPLEVLRLQLRLEGLEVVDGDRLRQVEVVPGEDLPLMILAHLADGTIEAYFDESLPNDLCQLLREQTRFFPFPVIGPFTKILDSRNITRRAEHYKTCRFPSSFLNCMAGDVECRPSSDPQVQAFGFGDFAQRVYIAEQDGRIVSACVSVRENERCGEAWVYTDPGYRRHGLGQQAVSAWAKDILSAGKIPLYSYEIRNTASAGLAKRLGLLPMFEEIVISYAAQ